MSYPNEQMAKDLLDDDSSDISDLELEVSTGPEGSKGGGINLLPRKRNNSDPGSSQSVLGQITPIGNDARNYAFIQEKLPSFEELTKSMQDLAEKDLDEFPGVESQNISSTMMNRGKSTEEITLSETQIYQGRQFSRNGYVPIEKQKQSLGSQTVNDDYISKETYMKRTELNKNNNKEEFVDTSESFRNIQQEIENLLAPLTPIQDYESVPKAVKTSDNKELFVLMNKMVDNPACNRKPLDNQHIRDGSFEIVENNEKEFEEARPSERWSFLGHKQTADHQFVGRKCNMKEEMGSESSETETEDHMESDDESNGNLCYEGETKVKENSMTNIIGGKPSNWAVKLDKEIKDMENSVIASSKHITKGVKEEEMTNTIEDMFKYFENSVKISSKFMNYGGLSGEGSAPVPRLFFLSKSKNLNNKMI